MNARDANGDILSRDERLEPDGTWSAVVWFGLNPATCVRRQYGYVSRDAARDADIGEPPEKTNACYRRGGPSGLIGGAS